MEIFFMTLKQMLMMFTFILIGFLMRKKNLLPDNSDTTMAKLETYIFVPALTLFNQITQCTSATFRENYVLILCGLALVLFAIVISYPLSRLFVKKDSDLYQRNIYKYALTFGNFGFMGNYIILGVWGNELFYKYLLFTFFLNALCQCWGLYILIPKEENANLWENLKKGMTTPPIIALILGVLLGLINFKQYVPEFIINVLDNAGHCQGAVAMILAGLIIGRYNLKDILGNGKVYIAAVMRLIILPSLMMISLKLLGTNDETMTLALIAFATPLGMNTVVFPAAYGGDTKTGASMAMISHTFSVITIPLMYLIFIILL